MFLEVGRSNTEIREKVTLQFKELLILRSERRLKLKSTEFLGSILLFRVSAGILGLDVGRA